MSDFKQRLYLSGITGSLCALYFLPFLANDLFWQVHWQNGSNPHWVFAVPYLPIAFIAWIRWLFGFKIVIDEQSYPFKLITFANFFGALTSLFGIVALFYLNGSVDSLVENSVIGIKIFLAFQVPGVLFTLITAPPEFQAEKRLFHLSLQVAKISIFMTIIFPVIAIGSSILFSQF